MYVNTHTPNVNEREVLRQCKSVSLSNGYHGSNNLLVSKAVIHLWHVSTKDEVIGRGTRVVVYPAE